MKAMQLLKKDHNAVKRLFTEFNRTTARALKKRRELVEKIATELDVHARIEEEIFYPSLQDLNEARQLLEEAREAHQEVRELIQELRAMEPGDKEIKARGKELREAVLHHVREEEQRMFPVAERLGDERLSQIAGQLEDRKRELMEEQMPSGRRGRRAA